MTRRIDAEALKKELNRLGWTEENGFKNRYVLDDIIDNAPTVEPQDRWGKWVISEVQCPECLGWFNTDCYSMEELNKCPGCGADLKGEEE